MTEERSAIYLPDLPAPDRDAGLQAYCEIPAIAHLGWPSSVVDQWLFDHREHLEFLEDYGSVDLSRIRWRTEFLGNAELEVVPTGPSEQSYLDEVPTLYEHWTKVRPPEVIEAWSSRGTWLVPPVLISRSLLNPPASGLQLIEGRTRVGILRGRRANGLHVCAHHEVWVGRPDEPHQLAGVAAGR